MSCASGRRHRQIQKGFCYCNGKENEEARKIEITRKRAQRRSVLLARS